MRWIIALTIGTALAAATAPAADLPGAEKFIYKTVGGRQLELFVFQPGDHKAGDKRPAVVFFHGGGWRNGDPGAMMQQCRYFAGRGMVAITAQYRLSPEVKIESCVSDAVSAMRWVRANAGRLGIDPSRIAAGGGSAGGHLAAATALLEGFDEPGEDTKTSAKPDALLLFNPALMLAPAAGSTANAEKWQQTQASLADRIGTTPENISPFHHIKPGAPPTLIMHGTADTTVPFATAELFTKAMTAAGNRCDLIPYPGRPHSFFNSARSREDFDSTMKDCDKFLTSLGWLPAAPSPAASPSASPAQPATK